MNSTELDVKRIYELAWLVHQKLGETVQADSETWWHVYEDEQIRIPNSGGHPPDSFRVYLKRGYSGDLVLEWHAVNIDIDTKEALLLDMLHHSDWCDESCPGSPRGLGRAVARRAYEIYLHRGMNLSSDLDDWLQAEKEILQELEERYSGNWEVQTIYGSSYGMEGRPIACVILKRGPWIEHLVHLASTCS